jgi:hypothetical protein
MSLKNKHFKESSHIVFLLYNIMGRKFPEQHFDWKFFFNSNFIQIYLTSGRNLRFGLTRIFAFGQFIFGENRLNHLRDFVEHFVRQRVPKNVDLKK